MSGGSSRPTTEIMNFLSERHLLRLVVIYGSGDKGVVVEYHYIIKEGILRHYYRQLYVGH